MIVKLYKHPNLEPDEVHLDVWNLKIQTEDGEVDLNINEKDGKLHLSVDSQIVIEPCSSNMFNVYSRCF